MFKQLHTKGGVRTGLYIFVMVSTILGNYGSLNLSIPVAQAASGSIWTTTGSCGSPQNSNHYNVGDHVFINASGFDADTPYSWDITGQPSSGDPNTAVASGSQLTDDSGAVCFDAYTIQADDSGEYKATYGDKHDNYQVNGQPAAPQCGNGIIETGETCDDGNTVSGDGCSSQCQIEVPQQGPQCGNGVIESGETCDDGNTVNGDGCNSQCQIETPSSSIKVVATKIVCQNESDLPNWGETGMPDITASTSADFLATHPTCHLQSDWKFQWGFGDKDGQEGVDKLPGAFVGEADGTDTTGMCSAPWCGPNTNTGTGYSDWKTFGPTGSDGTTSVDITDMQGANQLWVREVLQDGYIPFTYPPQGPNENNVTAEIYCHTDTNHYDNYDSVDNPTAGNTYYCVAFNAPKAVKVVATKIVCQNESDLPNWGETGMPDITASTSADFLATHPTCHLQSDWKFQWGFGDKDGQEGVDKLPGAFVGEADGTDTTGMCSAPWCGPNTNTGTGYSDWKTFGPTGSDGTTSVDITDMQGANQLWVREVLQDGYIPFTYPPQGPNENNVTAEIYCHTDTNHYDNYDSVDNPTAGNTYYCVAFNAPKVTPPTDLCPNIEGDQAEVPQGYAINSDGQCVPDVCPNLDGIQSSLPDGYTVNNDGQCVLITDLCPNIDGIQASIPDGMILNNDGQCVDSGSGGGPITTSGGGGGGSHGGGGGIPDFPNQPTGPQDNPQVKGFSTSAPADNPSVLGFELLPNTGGSLTDYYVTTSLLFALILGGLYVSYRKRSAANS